MKKFTTLFFAAVLTLSLNAQNSLKRKGSKNQYEIIKKSTDIKADHPKNVEVFYENFDVWPLTGWGFYELGDTVGWTDLVTFGGTNGGYLGPNAAMHTYEALTGTDDWMVSPAISIVDNSTMLSCWQHVFSPGTYATAQIIVLNGQDPNTATKLDTLYECENEDIEYWEEISVSLGDFAGQTIYIGFRYAGTEMSQIWGIDELNISYSKPNDMAVSEFSPTWIKFNDKVFPVITVQNVGENTQNDFDVKVEIFDDTDNIYTDSKTITGANLAANETLEVTMNNVWEASIAGDLTVKASVTLAGDEAPGNDTLEIIVPVVDFKYDYDLVYAYNIVDKDNEFYKRFVSITTNDATIELLPDDNHFFDNNIYAGDYVGTYDTAIIVAVNETGKVSFIDKNGSAYYHGQLTGPTISGIYGFTWGQKTNKYFITDGYKLYNVDFKNLTYSEIGLIIQEPPGIVSIAADTNGEMYGINVLNNKFYSINTETGTGTEIGEIGFDINNAQDIGFDRTTNTLYGTLYGSTDGSTSESGLYTFNLETGNVTLVGSLFSLQNELSVCAIYSTPEVGIINKNSADVSISPNPTSGLFKINANDNYTVKVIDVTGKIVLQTLTTNNSTNIDLSFVQNGVYIVHLSNAKQTVTYKLIKN